MNQQRTMLAARAEFCSALAEYAVDFGFALAAEQVAGLSSYYELVREWNPRLHLVAPCTATEFALRHVLESLLVTRFVQDGVRIVDVGAGAGLPSVPALLVKPSLCATLIEASSKKAIFLRECAARLNLSQRMEVTNERFENIATPQAEALTCRALDRFTELLPKILDWAEPIPKLILFGGPSIQTELERMSITFSTFRIPHSEQRSIFIIERQS